MVLQKNVLFSGTIKENLRWGNENATDEELERGLPPGTGGRVHPHVSRRLRHLHRAGRRQRVRRAEAAPVHRACAAEKAQDPDPGRFHQRRGHPRRTPLIRQAFAEEIPDTTKIHHRPAHQLRAGRGPDPRAGRRPHDRLRHPRRAACEPATSTGRSMIPR